MIHNVLNFKYSVLICILIVPEHSNSYLILASSIFLLYGKESSIMIIKSVLIVVCLVICISGADSKNCSSKEIDMTCGTACEPSCEDPAPQWCTLNCVQGCFCKDDLVRGPNNSCIEYSKCPTARDARDTTCRTGEVYKECGLPCTKTCQNPNPGNCSGCIPGCYCPTGYVRNEQGLCIPVEQCPNTELRMGECIQGEEWSDCGLSCQPNCADLSPTCDKRCTRGCFCAQGTVRSTASPLSPCVPVANCTKTS